MNLSKAERPPVAGTLRGSGDYRWMRLVFDIETNSFLDDKLTTIHCIAVRNLDNIGETWCFGPDEIDAGLELLQRAEMLVAHNGITFDIPVIEKLYPHFNTHGIKLMDTLVLSRLIRADLKNDDFTNGHKYPKIPKKLYGSHSLEAWGHRLGYQKGISASLRTGRNTPKR